MRKRIRTKVAGLVAHVTPNATKRSSYRSALSIAMVAHANGTITEEQMEFLVNEVAKFKDTRINVPCRRKRGILAKKMVILGKEFEITEEDLAEFKEYQEKRNRMHKDKSLKLLICEE